MKGYGRRRIERVSGGAEEHRKGDFMTLCVLGDMSGSAAPARKKTTGFDKARGDVP
jgi:hypothetical protein